jgi:nitroimidazol reductase NimA-like FMN-containing flavoprotein (pyridoxamine 5'-phosphate oxidase superfamily)
MRRVDREVSGRDELRALIEKADACHLAFAVDDQPYIVTMNFGCEWPGDLPVLYFHCAREGQKLDMMRRNPRVCFELDGEHELTTGSSPCDWGMKYASVVGYGLLSEIADEGERRRGLDLVMRHYGWGGDGAYQAGPMRSATVLRLVVSELSGKRKS